MMSHQHIDQILSLWTMGIHVFESVSPHARTALIHLLVRIELRVHKKTTLQVVDPKLRRFLVSYGAQMSRDLDLTFVRRLNRSFQFCPRDAKKNIERSHTAIPCGQKTRTA